MALVKPEKKLNWNLNQQSTVRISHVCVRISLYTGAVHTIQQRPVLTSSLSSGQSLLLRCCLLQVGSTHIQANAETVALSLPTMMNIIPCRRSFLVIRRLQNVRNLLDA